MFDWWRRLSRADVIAQPFPVELRELLLRTVPCAQLLTGAERERLEALVRIFNSEKSFEAAGGLTLTYEMRVAIAGRACLLVLWRVELDEPLYPELDTIIVYPSTYQASVTKREGYVHFEGNEARLGESWQRGAVVISWAAAQAGAANPVDGHDVVLHEFAHQLDAEDGGMDGTPELGSLDRYAVWSKVAGREYAALIEDLERHRPTTIDPYGATNAPEFFAVLVEQFFEKPRALAAQHAALYRELAAFFRFDPAARLEAAAR